MQSRISCTQGWPKHHNLSLSMRQDLSILKRPELRINTVDISHPALANWCWLSFSQYCQTRVWQRCLFEVLISVPVLRVYESRSYVNLAVNNMNTSVNWAIDPLVWKKMCLVYVVLNFVAYMLLRQRRVGYIFKASVRYAPLPIYLIKVFWKAMYILVLNNRRNVFTRDSFKLNLLICENMS